MSRFAYVPEGPRADALMQLDREFASSRVAGIPGKVSIFHEPLYGQPYVQVVVLPKSDVRFTPLMTEQLRNPSFQAQRVTFDAIAVVDDRKKRLYAYCNEPKHLDEFSALDGPRYTVVVSDVYQRALPPVAT